MKCRTETISLNIFFTISPILFLVVIVVVAVSLRDTRFMTHRDPSITMSFTLPFHFYPISLYYFLLECFFYLVWVFFSVSVKVQNRVGALRLRCVKYRLTVINERATPPLRHSAATPPLLRRYCHPQRLTAFIKALMNTFLFFHCEMFKQSEFKGKTWKLTLITSNYTTTFCRVACKQHFFTR